jgi:hypothetical protein
MMRAVVGAALLVVVLAGSFVLGAVHVIAGETWPEF